MLNTKVIDITSWLELPNSAVPIGKRVKNVIVNPDDNSKYYFKLPESKYPWEQWTEIAASKIGAYFNFNIVNYEIGILKGDVGSLSKSMVDDFDDLIHGQQLLTQIKPSFEKKKGSDHTFQLISELIHNNDKLKSCFDAFLQMLVFDAIIGNRDRHQQNWGFIRSVKVAMKNEKLDAKKFKKDKTILAFLWSLITKRHAFNEIIENIQFSEEYKFTPYFDNGNCLAYNITEQSVVHLLENDQSLDKYLFGSKATSHIKWVDKNLSHHELLSNILTEHPSKLQAEIQRCIDIYSEDAINNIIHSLDADFDSNSYADYQLTLQRKTLMCKLIKLRLNKLATLI